jgi:hypothetical protein
MAEDTYAAGPRISVREVLLSEAVLSVVISQTGGYADGRMG